MPATPAERIRTLRACTACSARKVKCDGLDQCAACKKHNVQCVYVNSGKKRGPPKGAPARGGPKRKVVDSASPTAPKDAKPVLGDMRPPAHVDRRLAPMVRIVTPPTLDSASPVTPFDSILGLETESSMPDGMKGMMDFNHGLLSPATTTGQSSTVPLPQQMAINQMVGSTASPASAAPSVGAHAGLTDDQMDELLLLYETFIHQHWPIIYLPALRSLRSLETLSPLVFDAVLALSATNQDLGHVVVGDSPSEARYARGPYGVLSETLVESVRQRILSSLGACDLPTIQACILITLVDIGYGRMQFAYHMGGIACRMAIDLGLHTMCAPAGVRTTPGRKEHEQYRTLWACFILDKILAALLQRPPMMRSVVIDTPRPSTMERDELDLWLAGRASHYLQAAAVSVMECSKSHALSSFNAWIDIMVILEDILEHVYRPSECRARIENPETAGRHYDELVVGIDGALRAWRRNLPPHLQWEEGDPRAHQCVGPHVLTLRGWFYTCMVLVHRPRVPFLDAAASPHNDAAEALSRMSQTASSAPQLPAHKRLPKGIDASRDAASAICNVLEGYKHSFRVRKFPSMWVYMIFQAGTVHGGLAARPSPSPFEVDAQLGVSPQRVECFQRLEQCISWLDQIGITWASASHHSEILRRISALGAKTRPPSPRFDELVGARNVFELSVPGVPNTDHLTATVDPNQGQSDDLLNSWMLFWAGMPTASDDLSLWQGFESMFTDNPQINPSNHPPLQ
ncbi:hypothetical protein CC85DRAFT_285640 [Cutaneotrichosporon oleaginosum]|uniref:Zn(2)-C6 fungal-type domain-containing protein n=1 Tax=Cutaneotrichosporon oleaginosum TaxID=879819 RepID=A0A0J0XM81_9TREE|nr:uncharacterized protein CC85DRAFT_285640 [Cutaneotrichosporon oleaginosum]KLT42230.1 hypothetical protein CC85DRAFT_285640 [Cutaneotrichosporon oleaginosum]TXT11404.1 hypothetical protein COLE_01814 [Cutaneotrichosporon oleaginosum]